MIINKYTRTLKLILGAIAIVASIILIQGCGVTDSDDPNVFTVPFEIVVPVTQNTLGTYNVSSGRFSAKFPDREDAVSYTFRVIREDGTINDPVTRRKNQLPIVNGIVEYGVVVGTPTFVFDVGEGVKEGVINEFMKELQAWSHIYHRLEVTVNQ